MTGFRFVLCAALLAACACAQEHVGGGELGARICAGADADNWHFPHPTECNRFIKCDVANGLSSIITCPDGLLYNADAEVCDHPANVDCSPKPAPDPNPALTAGPPATEPPAPPAPTELPAPPAPPTGDWAALCLPYDPHRYHVAHPTDATKFYKCDWTVRVAYEFDCPAGLTFDAAIQVCNW